MRTKILFVFALTLLAAPSSFAQYVLQDAYPNLPAFSRPIEMQQIPDGTNRNVVVEQRGKVWVINDSSLTSSRRLFLDLSAIVSQNDNEVGLLGCAFHPDYVHNHFVYFNYTTGNLPQYYSHIFRYTVSTTNPDSIIPGSALELLAIAQPYNFPNHKGGCLRFGNDGYLYASFGDGGSGGDPYGNGQNTTVLLGKMLRLDVDHPMDTLKYGIPPTNPFANDNAGKRKEIYAYGLRNTWRFTFDKPTGTLWAGDVGQDHHEEIDTIEAGKNYGWNTMEGFYCYPSGALNCDSTGMTPPIWDYPHISGNNCIIGGFVYHGKRMPGLLGQYIYGDDVSGRMWALSLGATVSNKLLIDKGSSTNNITTFCQDTDGEIIAVVLNTGRMLRLVDIASVKGQSDLDGLRVLSVTSVVSAARPIVKVSIASSSGRQLSVSLVDALGRTFELGKRNVSAGTSDLLLDLKNAGSDLSAGLYFIRLASSDADIQTKIIVE